MSKPQLEKHLGLAHHLARQFKGYLKDCPTLTYNDLLQEALIGLHNACEAYDPEKGIDFGWLAGTWIRQQVSTLIKKNGTTVKLPRLTKKDLESFKTDESAGDELNHRVIAVMNYKAIPIEHYEVEDDSRDEDENEMKLYQALQHLSEKEQQIISNYYGLNGPTLTLEEIGSHFKITRVRAGQIIKRIQQKLGVLMVTLKNTPPHAEEE